MLVSGYLQRMTATHAEPLPLTVQARHWSATQAMLELRLGGTLVTRVAVDLNADMALGVQQLINTATQGIEEHHGFWTGQVLHPIHDPLKCAECRKRQES